MESEIFALRCAIIGNGATNVAIVHEKYIAFPSERDLLAIAK